MKAARALAMPSHASDERHAGAAERANRDAPLASSRELALFDS